MAANQRKDFITSPEGMDISQTLRNMMADSAYHTPSSYSANSTAYPDNQMPFDVRHMIYLTAHPKLDAWQYVANIKLMSRKK
ncbi:MAG TPA: hypothetical protein VK978_02795 [Candidatus Saccharimonadales bacterium]|nr:hypothetical protein [Candidatus Saccharimonadales bacterium]